MQIIKPTSSTDHKALAVHKQRALQRYWLPYSKLTEPLALALPGKVMQICWQQHVAICVHRSGKCRLQQHCLQDPITARLACQAVNHEPCFPIMSDSLKIWVERRSEASNPVQGMGRPTADDCQVPKPPLTRAGACSLDQQLCLPCPALELRMCKTSHCDTL